ncbi:MAG: hypothetical protein JWO89_2770, partial [Verrucomicrobiaceae bacterium]|nr:hypothetical protein [Verrucomicrobiaceae bacterium]
MMSSRHTLFVSLLLVSTMMSIGQTQAAIATWSSGSGAWNQTGKWNTGVVPGTSLAGDVANFGASTGTANTITLDNGAGAVFSPTLTNLNVNAAGAA